MTELLTGTLVCPHCLAPLCLEEGLPLHLIPLGDSALYQVLKPAMQKKVNHLLQNGWYIDHARVIPPQPLTFTDAHPALPPEQYHNREMVNRLYSCPKCKTIETRFAFTLKKGNSIYHPNYQCAACRSPLHLLPQNRPAENYNIRCPKCKTISPANHWKHR